MSWQRPLAEQAVDLPLFLLVQVLPRLSLSQPQRPLQA